MAHDADGYEDLEAGLNEAERAGSATLLDLFNFTTRQHIWCLSLALILSTASGIIIPAFAIFLGKVFNEFTLFGAAQITGGTLVDQVSTYSIALCVLGGANGILNSIFYCLWLMFGEYQARSAREKLFTGMLGREMEWYDLRDIGIEALVSRLHT